MVNLIEPGQTMTSMQIAEATSKHHKDVLRAIRSMEPAWEKTRGRKFALTFIIKEMPNGATRKDPYYELTKTECLYIATKFNDEARARLILRWEQLETERLQQSQETEILPPPISNSLHNSELVEVINGRSVTTSRKLAKLLGRDHGSVLETIRNNLGCRRLQHYQFTSRDYRADASGRSYEFLITRKGLAALAGVMRYGAKGKIEAAYKGAWSSKSVAAVPVLPMPEDTVEEAQPETIQSETAVAEPTETYTDDAEMIDTPEQKKYIDWLEGYNEMLTERLRKVRAMMRMYADMYANEKNRRRRNGDMSGYWHDLYQDLLWRVVNGTVGTKEERMESHLAFKKRISGK